MQTNSIHPYLHLVLAGLLIVSMNQCKKDNKTAPTVKTNPVTNLSITKATCGGYLVDDGGDKITARGICFSKTAAPTISDSVLYSSETVIFMATIKGLQAGTKYYVRAFANNGHGTGYGNTVEFVTSMPTSYVVLLPLSESASISNYRSESSEFSAASFLLNISPHTPYYFQVVNRFFFTIILGVIPSHVSIDSAKISLYANSPSGSNVGSNDCYLERIRSPWSPDSVTWWNQPSTTTLNQIVVPGNSGSNDMIGLDITDLLRDSYANPDSIFGYMFRLINEVGENCRTFNLSIPEKRPKIEVYYTTRE